MIKRILKRFYTKPFEFNYNVNSNSKKALILGTHNSINKINLQDYKDCYKISLGNFFEHQDIDLIAPDCHVFAGSHPPITDEVFLNWFKRCDLKLPKKTKILLHRKDKKIAEKAFKNRELFYYSTGGIFPINFRKKIISPQSVSLVGLQLAIYFEFKTILLLGIKHDWQQVEKYTHFYSHDKPSLEYYLEKNSIKISYEEQTYPFPKEYLYSVYNLYKQYEDLKQYAEKKGISIFNADPYSSFDVFKKYSN